jgi:hypothetical protein
MTVRQASSSNGSSRSAVEATSTAASYAPSSTAAALQQIRARRSSRVTERRSPSTHGPSCSPASGTSASRSLAACSALVEASALRP